MIAIDTNVLLRYLLFDDALQSPKAKKIIERKAPVLITDVVLVETLWTLSGKRYKLDKAALCRVVRALMGDGAFVFENNQVVWTALRDYEDSKRIKGKDLDFSDALICQKSHFIAENTVAINNRETLAGFYSFDKAVKQLKGAETP